MYEARIEEMKRIILDLRFISGEMAMANATRDAIVRNVDRIDEILKEALLSNPPKR